MTPQKIHINLDDQPMLQCQCGCTHFLKLSRFVLISRVLAGSSDDLIQEHPVPALQCRDCKKNYDAPQELLQHTPEINKTIHTV